MSSLVKIYIENVDGVYSVYDSKTNPYITRAHLKEASVSKEIAEYLCKVTSDYNEAQDTMFYLYND
jgi:hypothetical protein